MNTYELKPVYDTAKSFYGKARVLDIAGGSNLYSYDVKVVSILDKPRITCRLDQLTKTTLRHIKDFLKQNGYEAETKAQILKDYKNN